MKQTIKNITNRSSSSRIRPDIAGVGGAAFGAAVGEAAGALVGNKLEARGIRTNLQLTNSEGKLDIGLAFSNRNSCNEGDKC